MDPSKLMTVAGVTELMREEHNWAKRYSTCEKIMAEIPLTVKSKDSLMASSHLMDPELTVCAVLPSLHLVTFESTVLKCATNPLRGVADLFVGPPFRSVFVEHCETFFATFELHTPAVKI